MVKDLFGVLWWPNPEVLRGLVKNRSYPLMHKWWFLDQLRDARLRLLGLRRVLYPPS